MLAPHSQRNNPRRSTEGTLAPVQAAVYATDQPQVFDPVAPPINENPEI